MKYGVETFILGQLETNCYLFHSPESKFCFIIDPADKSEHLAKFIEEKALVPLAVILTHGHIDHCGGASFFCERYNIEMAMHEADREMLDSPINVDLKNSLGLTLPPLPSTFLRHGETFEKEDLSLTVHHTPGHTPGSVCLQFEETVFSGDTLFFGSIGRTDLPGGDFGKIKKSLDYLMTFPDETKILPGHGDATSIGQEKTINPFL